jgi:hypothetical protein
MQIVRIDPRNRRGCLVRARPTCYIAASGRGERDNWTRLLSANCCADTELRPG